MDSKYDFIRNNWLCVIAAWFMNKMRIGIGLCGKGATNHLHRHDIVNTFFINGFRVSFLVREDYMEVLTRIDGCSYVPCRIRDEVGWRMPILRVCQNLRKYYPAADSGQLRVHKARNLPSKMRWWSWIYLLLNRFLARYYLCAVFAAWLERYLFRHELVQGVEPDEFDLLVLLGIGTVNAELEGMVSKWAEHHKLPCLHVIGNYDHVVSKGFRGILPKRLLVWSSQMAEDAISYQGLDRSSVKIIGSLRYNSFFSSQIESPDTFFRKIGFSSKKKTIVFAGFIFESQYFEMIRVFSELVDCGIMCQLILRLYPNKSFMNSIYIEPLVKYANSY